MSECSKEKVKCPRCGYDSPMEIWSSINVDLDPELKEEFLTGRLFEWKCEVCGHESHVLFDTLYHDMEHRFMLYFAPLEIKEGRYSALDIPFSPDSRMPGYTFRKVYGWNALVEKIGILEQGLSDVAIERMKYFLRLDNSNHIGERDELVFAAIATDPETIRKTGWARGAIIFERLGQEPDSKTFALPLESYYDYLLAATTDPRMKTEGCSCIDADWIDLKLRQP